MPRRRYRYTFVPLTQFTQDTYALDPARAAVLAAALKVMAVDPQGALGAFLTWNEDAGDLHEGLLDLAGWGILGYQIDEYERLVVLRWIQWD